MLKKILALEWLSSDHSMTGSDMDRPSRVSFTPQCGFKGQDIGGVAHDFCAPRVEIMRFWSTGATAEHVANGVTGERSIPSKWRGSSVPELAFDSPNVARVTG